MKRILFISLSLLFALSLSAQRKVRKETHKGDNNYREQRYGAAEEKYKAAMELYTDPKNKDVKEEEKSKEAFYNLGNTYYRQGRWNEAIEGYSNYQKIEIDPMKQSGAWSNIGNTYLHKATEKTSPDEKQAQAAASQGGGQQQQEQLPRMEDLNKSMDAYKNALRLNPTDDESRYNLAIVQKMIQDQKDKNKDDNQDQDQDKQDQKQDQQQQNKDQQDKQDQKQDQQEQKQDNQMSQENIEQILNAIEQDEKETQSRIQQQKAEERKKMNARNKKQNKDW